MAAMRLREMIAGLVGITALLGVCGPMAHARIDGVTGTFFSLVAKQDFIATGDGDTFLMWGYAPEGGRMQYPGPVIKVNQGDVVTVTLRNELPAQAGNVSIVFPGHEVKASGGVQGVLTREAAQADDPATPQDESMVVYEFTAANPGTYLYRSGTRPDLQVEMGLVGAIIVYPTGGGFNDGKHAYNHSDSRFDREFLFLITEMDPRFHRYVESGRWALIDTTTYFPTAWFINGRNWPDVMADAFVPWLPTQPYNCQPRMHPGERVLIRLVGAGRDLHPMHLHGNDFEVIAISGRLMTGVAGADLAFKEFTLNTVPGQTADVLWSWTGEKLGWDIYGHVAGDPANPGCNDGDGDGLDDVTFEYCADHNVPFPVTLPTRDSLTYGPFYSGSPFLGGGGALPPGDPGLNANGGFFYMWHSHTEKELTTNDIWPGGLVSFMIVEPPWVPILE